MKLRPQTYRRIGGRLKYIDLPIGVRAVRNVEPYAGKPVGFIARPWLAAITEAQPAPGEEETFVAVDVEALLLALSGESYLRRVGMSRSV